MWAVPALMKALMLNKCCHYKGGDFLPSIFARSETFDARSDSSVDQILLGLVVRICKKLDKRQKSVYSFQGFRQICFIAVIYNKPVDPGWNTIRRANL